MENAYREWNTYNKRAKIRVICRIYVPQGHTSAFAQGRDDRSGVEVDLSTEGGHLCRGAPCCAGSLGEVLTIVY